MKTWLETSHLLTDVDLYGVTTNCSGRITVQIDFKSKRPEVVFINLNWILVRITSTGWQKATRVSWLRTFFYSQYVLVLLKKCLESLQHISADDKARMWRPETCSFTLHIHEAQQGGIQLEGLTSRTGLPICEYDYGTYENKISFVFPFHFGSPYTILIDLHVCRLKTKIWEEQTVPNEPSHEDKIPHVCVWAYIFFTTAHSERIEILGGSGMSSRTENLCFLPIVVTISNWIIPPHCQFGRGDQRNLSWITISDLCNWRKVAQLWGQMGGGWGGLRRWR